MIIAKLQHGLGNQMFQYALGKRLSLLHNTKLKLDVSTYETGSDDRLYGLHHFNIKAEIAEPQDFRRLHIPPPTTDLISRIRRKMLRMQEGRKPLAERRFIIESRFTFIPEILSTKDNTYLVGDWQSEKYFKEIATTLRQDLSLKDPMDKAAAQSAELIQQTNGTPVSLHVRRGDIVTNQRHAEKYGSMPLSYHIEAVQLMRERVPDTVLYVFSDDIVWAQEKLSGLQPIIFVSNPKTRDYEEFALMGLCTHHILPNSTFSWWSAWLNPNPNKIVIAPRKYFRDTRIDTSDLMPPEWMQL